ncbi:MAG: DUF4411 family protein [Bacteroidales bacterium]|nr:DUF4411 family protein [Bacteroidales bacterium]
MFLLDTNVFIEAKDFLPIDVHLSFWRKMKELGEKGDFASIEKVKQEILKGKDSLKDWISILPKEYFISASPKTLVCLGEVVSWSQNNSLYNDSAKEEFANVADSWLIAEAKAKGYTVVTFETSDPKCKKRVKIPDVCNGLGVDWCNLNEAFRRLGETI